MLSTTKSVLKLIHVVSLDNLNEEPVLLTNLFSGKLTWGVKHSTENHKPGVKPKVIRIGDYVAIHNDNTVSVLDAVEGDRLVETVVNLAPTHYTPTKPPTRLEDLITEPVACSKEELAAAAIKLIKQLVTK
ncbi:hypothetical protein ABN214_15195 [Proteus terrae]|uniref:hypothetical protein n=1 Tax=Proteus terrae TaxID=1574161 RepID=UPI0032DA8713